MKRLILLSLIVMAGCDPERNTADEEFMLWLGNFVSLTD